MKLLLLLVIVYLVYRAVKSWAIGKILTSGPVGNASNSRLDDVMVKDPVCGIHFPRREGVALEHEGQTLLFCSTDCRDRFLKERQ